MRLQWKSIKTLDKCSNWMDVIKTKLKWHYSALFLGYINTPTCLTPLLPANLLRKVYTHKMSQKSHPSLLPGSCHKSPCQPQFSRLDFVENSFCTLPRPEEPWFGKSTLFISTLLLSSILRSYFVKYNMPQLHRKPRKGKTKACYSIYSPPA